MILKAPGVQSGRFDTPTSLLDVAPTLAKLAGIDSAGMMGEDLRGLASGETTARFEKRPLSFGRPLYGLRRWGSLRDGIKYTTHAGDEEIYNLNKDPAEATNIIDRHNPTEGRQAVGESLDRPFVKVLRLVLNKVKSGRAVQVKIKHPAAAAWVGNDPTMKGRARVTLEDDRVIARWPKQRGMVEVFVVPSGDLPDQVSVEMTVGKRTETYDFDTVGRAAPPPGTPDTLLTARLSGRKLTINTAWAPIPSDVDGAIDGFDAEVAGDLESLGYIEKDE